MQPRTLSVWIFLTFIFQFPACSGLPGQAGSSSMDELQIKISDKTFENQEIAALLISKKGRSAGIIEFENCTFNGQTHFISPKGVYQGFLPSVIFRNCSFKGELSGEKIQFLGQVNFSKSSFSGNVNFQNASFQAPLGFRECNINQEFMFQNTLVMKEATWMGTHFYGISFFQGTRFFEKAQFQNVIFHANADFTLCRFDEGAMFDFARAEGKLDFSESRSEGLFTFRKAECQKRVELTLFKSFAPIRFYETTLQDSVVTKGMHFYSDGIEFKDTKGGFIPK
jgi:hypothetical protein